ncbi:Oidioi.mRNA.OKI2018_I69.chr2.g6443.t1.cds [Oikopleura dioica]|uniref:Oidioi.mRNA.OKI2018_I69.chr2.g6443.t1.cds n=1 Tax=Oikopleura dioica TaxID=34765 RepID=A0ABN7T3H0_OIKDI|nr:Oidioi.mRNA.OKI2018_I69.chr2.g6443.t1.cds [Oikopleura dioica]
MAQNPGYNPNFDTQWSTNQWSSTTAPPPAYGHTPLPGQQPVFAQPMPNQPTNPRHLGSEPMFCVCPHCKKEGMSSTQKDTGLGNHLGALGCIIVGCVLGCCFIPYCIDDLKDTVHTCSSCQRVIGTKTHFLIF